MSEFNVNRAKVKLLYSIVHVAMKIQKRQILSVNQNLSSEYAMS